MKAFWDFNRIPITSSISSFQLLTHLSTINPLLVAYLDITTEPRELAVQKHDIFYMWYQCILHIIFEIRLCYKKGYIILIAVAALPISSIAISTHYWLHLLLAQSYSITLLWTVSIRPYTQANTSFLVTDTSSPLVL